MKNPKFTLGIRIIAGCYLIYLAYQIISGGLMKGELHSGQWQFWVSLIGSIVPISLFAVITETSPVRSDMYLFNTSAATTPWRSTGKYATGCLSLSMV